MDHHDRQLHSYYPIHRNIKWHSALLLGLLKIAVNNTWTVARQQQPKAVTKRSANRHNQTPFQISYLKKRPLETSGSIEEGPFWSLARNCHKEGTLCSLFDQWQKIWHYLSMQQVFSEASCTVLQKILPWINVYSHEKSVTLSWFCVGAECDMRHGGFNFLTPVSAVALLLWLKIVLK